MRPRRFWYLVAALTALVLGGIGVALIVATVRDSVNSVDTSRSFAGGEVRTFHLVRGETKAIYVSQAGQGDIRCSIPEPWSGSMTQPDSSFRVTSSSRTWERVFEVRPGATGDYALTCTSERSAVFALGDPPHVGATIGRIAVAVGCLLAAVVGAVTIVVVTAVRRSRHRRRLAAGWASPPPWGSSPYGGPLP
ncbi:serine/arginine repetitive matrix protein 2 [Streptomyces sp. J2-1]|nr:serine/arginine repetitive matrix protein 2 [Streptomyces corallincola]